MIQIKLNVIMLTKVDFYLVDFIEKICYNFKLGERIICNGIYGRCSRCKRLMPP